MRFKEVLLHFASSWFSNTSVRTLNFFLLFLLFLQLLAVAGCLSVACMLTLF